MTYFKRNVFLILIFFISCLHAQTRIKAMFYNTLNYNSDNQSQSRTPYLKTILENVQPDILMICELKNETASNFLFTNAIVPFNGNFKKATFKNSESPAKDLLQMVYYNAEKLVLDAEEVIPTGVRDINHYTFKIKTENIETNPIRIEVFVTHLKASRGTENMQQRLESVENFARELDRLPKDSAILFAGDFNFYTSNELGFQKIINTTNPIKIIDPINRLCPTFPENGIDYFNENNYDSTYFWNNSTFVDVHSQSTRTFQVNGDGAGGGMDDRFDFIMMSENLTSNPDLYYMNNSYKTIGNNGNCFNSYVSNTDCTGEYSQELRNALYFFSDHLPISLEIETPQKTLSIAAKNIPIKFMGSNLISDFLTLHLAVEIENIFIYNQLGQKVFELKYPNKSEITITTSSFPNGIYYIKADGFKPLKFIKI